MHYPRYFFASACKRRPRLLERESHHKTLSPRRLSQQSFPQTSSLQRPSKTLLNMLTQIHTNLWTIDSISMSFVNAETNTSMTVAKLSNGSLWINSPIAWKTDVLRLLSAWVAELVPASRQTNTIVYGSSNGKKDSRRREPLPNLHYLRR